MKSLKINFTFVGLLLLLCVFTFDSAFAQGNSRGKARASKGKFNRSISPEKIAEKQTKRMAEKLDLTAEQKTKIQAINLKYAEDMMKARQSSAEGDRDAKRTAVREIRATKREAIAAVLTAEQRAKYEQARSPEGKAERRTSKLERNLNLDANQAAKIREINIKYAKDMAKLRSGNLSKEERKAKMKEVFEAQDKELAAVLDADQLAKYKEKRAKKMEKMERRGARKGKGMKRGKKMKRERMMKNGRGNSNN